MSDRAAQHEPSLGSLRMQKHLALALSLVSFGVLAFLFSTQQKPYYQVATGLVLYVSYMWHRSLIRRLEQAESQGAK